MRYTPFPPIAVGLRYGKGYMHRKNFRNLKVYWQGPSIGYDAGAGTQTMDEARHVEVFSR